MKSSSSAGGADDNNCNDDMCEMAAHYKVKYGLEGLEETISQASKRFSRSIDYHDNSPNTDINHDKTFAGSLPNLLTDECNSDDDVGDDIGYMVMQPSKKPVQHSASLDRLNIGTKPSHKPLAGSTSSGGAFTYSDSFTDNMPPNSIKTANGYLHSPTSVTDQSFNGNNHHPVIYENTDDVFNG